MTDVSRIVDRLILKGYVVKRTNTYDKRAAAVVITERGLSLLKKINRQVNYSSLLSERLTAEEASQLNILLAKVRGLDQS